MSKKEIRRQKLMSQPGKLGALWTENFVNVQRLKDAAKREKRLVSCLKSVIDSFPSEDQMRDEAREALE